MKNIGVCLSETELSDYLSGSLSPDKKLDIENHLASCAECLEQLTFAYECVSEYPAQKGVYFVKKKLTKNTWLLGAALAFILSFLFPKYFMQFLAATVLLGLKWIFDSSNAKILIMIYEAWKKGGEKEASKILGKFGDRF